MSSLRHYHSVRTLRRNYSGVVHAHVFRDGNDGDDVHLGRHECNDQGSRWFAAFAECVYRYLPTVQSIAGGGPDGAVHRDDQLLMSACARFVVLFTIASAFLAHDAR